MAYDFIEFGFLEVLVLLENLEERGRKNGKREGNFSRISRTTRESKHIGLWLNDLVFWKFWIDWRL